MPETTPTERRRWRWDQVAALLVIVGLAIGLALRPAVPGALWQAWRLNAQAERAHRLAAADPPAALARWQALAAARPDDDAWQALVWANRLEVQTRINRGVALHQLAEEARNQPAYVAGEPQLMLAAGLARLALDDARGAIEPLERGLRRTAERDSLALRLRAALALAHERGGRPEAAEQLWLGLTAAWPDELWLSVELARYWADRGIRLDEAETLARDALTAISRQRWLSWDQSRAARTGRGLDRLVYLDCLGWVLYRQGERAAGRELLEQARSQADAAGQPQPLNLYHLGAVYYDLGQDADALRVVDMALALDPTLGPAKLLRERLTGRGRQTT